MNKITQLWSVLTLTFLAVDDVLVPAEEEKHILRTLVHPVWGAGVSIGSYAYELAYPSPKLRGQCSGQPYVEPELRTLTERAVTNAHQWLHCSLTSILGVEEQLIEGDWDISVEDTTWLALHWATYTLSLLFVRTCMYITNGTTT